MSIIGLEVASEIATKIGCYAKGDKRCTVFSGPCIPVLAGIRISWCPRVLYLAGQITKGERDKRIVDLAIALNLNDPRRAA